MGSQPRCLAAQDEDDLRTVQVTPESPVERADDPHAEVVREQPSLVGEARSVHDDAARDALRRVADAADPVAVVMDTGSRGGRGPGPAVPVQDEDVDA